MNAFDNTTATKWLDFANSFPSTRSSWIQYQYANGLQCAVSRYTVSSANDAPERDPANWHLLGSNDGATWVTLDVQTNQVFTNRFQTQSYVITNTASYNVYRLQIDSVANPAIANSVQLSELEFIGTPAYGFSWSFGDGVTSTSQNPQHTYTSGGTYTVTLTVSDGTAAAVSTTNVTVMPLNLALALASPGNIKLNWSAWATNYTLYATTNLAPPASWSPVTNEVTSVGGVSSVTLPIGSGNQFFQLRVP